MTTNTHEGDHRLLRSGFVLLAAGALIDAGARLLIVPWYDESERYVEAIADHRTTHVAGSVLWFVAAFVILIGLVRLWAGSGLQSRTIGIGLTIGLLLPVGLGAVASCAFNTGSLGNTGETAAAVTTWEDLRASGAGGVGWYAATIGSLALVVVFVALARRRTIPRVPAALVAVGAIATALTSAGPITGVLVAAALTLSVGAAWAAAKVDLPGRERVDPRD